MGLPVIASDISGTREIVADHETGYLVPMDDTAGYAAAIRRVLGEPRLAQWLGERGRTIAEERFSAQRMLQANLDVYRLAPFAAEVAAASCHG